MNKSTENQGSEQKFKHKLSTPAEFANKGGEFSTYQKDSEIDALLDDLNVLVKQDKSETHCSSEKRESSVT